MTSPYITFRDKDSEGNLQYYVLQRDFPHYLGVVSSVPVFNIVSPAPLSGYNLWVVFKGTLRGNMIPSYQNVGDEISNVLGVMALWYYTDRILMDKKKYKKFKINDTSTGE